MKARKAPLPTLSRNRRGHVTEATPRRRQPSSNSSSNHSASILHSSYPEQHNGRYRFLAKDRRSLREWSHSRYGNQHRPSCPCTDRFSGLTLSYRLLINPIFNASLHPAVAGAAGPKLLPSSRLAIWHTAFNLGMKTIPPFAGVASVFLLSLGLRAGSTKDPKTQWMPVSPRTYLFAATAMQLFHIPFTVSLDA